jgi:tetratricopeptide (TPR) repeat protein
MKKTKHLKALTLTIFLVVCAGYLLWGKFSFVIGTHFFGKTPYLYNVNLANFFFKQSAYPILGKPVPYAHYQLSRTYFIKGDLSLALVEAKKELDVFPENTRTYYIIGLTYAYLNMEEQAIAAFQTFIEWKPESWAARNDKAWLEFRIGDIDAALETISPVTHLTDNAWVQNTYGVLLMNKGRYLEAKLAFANAKAAADKLTETEWGKVYPGNDPRIYTAGINATRKSIESNIELIRLK